MGAKDIDILAYCWTKTMRRYVNNNGVHNHVLINSKQMMETICFAKIMWEKIYKYIKDQGTSDLTMTDVKSQLKHRLPDYIIGFNKHDLKHYIYNAP